MKKIVLILLLAIHLQAKSFLISNIPIPPNYIIKVDTKTYSKAELDELYNLGYIFTLLAQDNLYDELSFKLSIHKQALNIQETIHKQLYHIAFLMPKKAIGRYATNTVNSAIIAMLKDNIDFKITVFDAKEFKESLQQIENHNYHIVVAPLTLEYAHLLCQKRLFNRYYIPTLHINSVQCSNENIIFGGIDYEAQVQSFIDDIDEPITLISNNSQVTSVIDEFVKQNYQVREHIIIKDAKNLKASLTKTKKILHEKVLFLNLPLVSATLFLSQLPLYEIEPKAIYATQILYNPNILKLTQYNDRKNLTIANSIQTVDDRDIGYASLLKNDLRYDWIDFTTAYGLFKILNNEPIGNQIQYSIEHIKPLRRSFVLRDLQ